MMFPQLDPSKMDPQTLMELSNLIRELPSEQLSRMQTLMHNAMGGFDVRKDMEEFERGLPPGFREKMLAIVSRQASVVAESSGEGLKVVDLPVNGETTPAMDMREARMTVLRAVANGTISPEDAEKLL
jgi:hypothetical protein